MGKNPAFVCGTEWAAVFCSVSENPGSFIRRKKLFAAELLFAAEAAVYL
jgi:hypothetical protein